MVFRWSLLFVVVVNAVWLVVWLVRRELPVAGTILVTNRATEQLPYALPRFVDPLAAIAPLALLIWLGFQAVDWRFKPVGVSGRTESAEDLYFWGLMFGLGGAFTGLAGLTALAVCAVVSSVVILLVAYEFGRVPPPCSFLVEATAVLVIWCLNTLLQGALSGLVYALAALALAAVTHFSLVGIGYGLRRMRDPFVRVMLPACDKDR
jgi:hypothetical protein